LTENDILKQRYENMSNKQLIEIALGDSDSYTIQGIELAKLLLQERGVEIDSNFVQNHEKVKRKDNNAFPEIEKAKDAIDGLKRTTQKISFEWFDLKVLLLIIVGIVLHMAFAKENYLVNYLWNTSSAGDYYGQRTIHDLIYATYSTFAYSVGGMLGSLLIITPLLYRRSERSGKNLFKCIGQGLLIGVVFRAGSYFIDTLK